MLNRKLVLFLGVNFVPGSVFENLNGRVFAEGVNISLLGIIDAVEPEEDPSLPYIGKIQLNVGITSVKLNGLSIPYLSNATFAKH